MRGNLERSYLLSKRKRKIVNAKGKGRGDATDSITIFVAGCPKCPWDFNVLMKQNQPFTFSVNPSAKRITCPKCGYSWNPKEMTVAA
jgi:hypothetical protein